MKKIVALCMFCTSIVFSQDFQGKATYKTSSKVSVKMKSGGDEALQKRLTESLKKMYQKTYVLNFNRKESTFIEEEQLSTGAPQGGVEVMMIGGGSNTILYKDISKNTYTKQKDLGGKYFLIEDNIEKYDWKMTGETKKIGNYTCYKATKTHEINRKSFMNTDGEKEQTEKKETITTTAWYTPEIPVSNGPKMLSGLPGLILEVQAGKTTIVCSEIILNPKEKIKIKKPKRGKKVTQKEYDKIMDKHSKEFMERYRSKKTKKGNNESISIQIGG